MKKTFLILAAFLIICPLAQGAESQKPQKNTSETIGSNIAYLTQKGYFEKAQQPSFLSPLEEVRRAMNLHLKYANCYNLEALKNLYADNYINADGLNKELYFELIKKTWVGYPDIKYRASIKNIEVDGDYAIVEVSEDAVATTDSKSGVVNEKGLLESASNSVYYLEKISNRWLITSDHVLFEKTFLRYGSARNTSVELTSPCQIAANNSYTATLKIVPPKDSLVIASVGQENITYPQTVAEEVFRKLPENGTLERVFKSNDKNINEYSVASFGITKAELRGTEIKIYVTGLGFVMSRVNVIPKNDFVKAENPEKIEKAEKSDKTEKAEKCEKHEKN